MRPDPEQFDTTRAQGPYRPARRADAQAQPDRPRNAVHRPPVRFADWAMI